MGLNVRVTLPSGYQLVRLANGVQSIRDRAAGETFHPVIGPRAEAEVLYAQPLRLRERLRAETGEFVVWDVGLGGAANVATVLRAAQDVPGRLRVVSFDRTLEPLRFALTHAAELGYFAGWEEVASALLHDGSVSVVRHALSLRWACHLGDFPTLLGQPAAAVWPKPHGILFDAFSPAKNPDMWTGRLFATLYRLLDPARPCVLPTYSRSTMLRVSLLLAGFYVGAGGATGEKEETTLAANTLTLVDRPLDRRWLGRARRSRSAEPLWTPHYRQAPLSDETWDRLLAHPQFR
jgi:tRNA U34 5-methylaminomethyl-2-thiouridine-forming methyltransferase MnmC